MSRRSTTTFEGADESNNAKKCLFVTQLELETEALTFQPSLEEFQSVLADTLERFQDCTLALPNLMPDDFFNAFTRLAL